MNVNKVIQHGEVALVPIDNIDINGEQHKEFIVAHSETGHRHVLESKKPFTISQSDKEFLIELLEPAKLVHKKSFEVHPTKTVNPGKYRVIYKSEYNPATKIIQRVRD